MTYRTSQPPGVRDGDYGPLVDWVVRELQTIEREFALFNFIRLKELHAEPAKRREGMLVMADGTNWNPGGGKGFYGYRGGAWRKLD